MGVVGKRKKRGEKEKRGLEGPKREREGRIQGV